VSIEPGGIAPGRLLFCQEAPQQRGPAGSRRKQRNWIMDIVYMDHHATTPLDKRVLEEMMPFLTEHFGNASSSTHPVGRYARKAVEKARGEVAQLIGAQPSEIIFTSGATESDNLAVKGIAQRLRKKGSHIITSVVEHKAILDPCTFLEKSEFEVTVLPVDSMGLVDPAAVEAAIRPETILVSIQAANSEVGTIMPITEIGAITRERGILFHTDAVQAVGKIPIDVDEINADLLSLSGHKMYGPKGVGALYIRGKNRVVPMTHGGGQERRLRSGTENVPGIVGLGAACRLAGEEMDEESRRLSALRDRLYEGIIGTVDGVTLNGHPEKRLPGNLNVSFDYVEGESIMMALKGFALSSGSACTSESLQASYVLMALGMEEVMAHCSIRFGLGHSNTEAQVDRLVGELSAAMTRLRAMSPLAD
jgi:cysteine desulfurase